MGLFACLCSFNKITLILKDDLIAYLSEYLCFDQQLSEYKEGTLLPCAKSFSKYIIFSEMYVPPFFCVKELVNSMLQPIG